MKRAGPAFFLYGFFARLPVAMIIMGTLTFMTTTTGSYAMGGFGAGAVGLGSAMGAPAAGFMADKIGQKPVLIVTGLAHAGFLLALIVFVLTCQPLAEPATAVSSLLLCTLVGLSSPQASSMARVRWMSMTKTNPAGLNTALSYESTADELTFVLGPALVGVIAISSQPWVPLAVAAVLASTAVLAFAAHPSVNQLNVGNSQTVRAAVPKKTWVAIAVPVAGMVSMGIFFGATSTAVTAFVTEQDQPNSGGLLYAAMGLSSAVTALSVAMWSPRFTLSQRWLLCSAGLFAGAAFLLLPSSIPPMVIALMLVGLFVGPVMVTIFGIGGQLAPEGRLSLVMTSLASGIVAGSALGSSLAGVSAHGAGSAGAFGITVAATVLMVTCASINKFVIARRQ